MALKLFVFDLAGTTVRDNRDVSRVLRQTLFSYQIHISLDEADTVMGIPKPQAIRYLLAKQKDNREPDDRFVNEVHHSFVADMIHFYQTDQSVGEKEGVSEVFGALRSQGIKVVVDTGFDRLITDTLLSRLGWKKKNLIDASVTSDEVANGRPYPDMIFKAMNLTAVDDASAVCKVGDTVVDLQQGNAAGCRYVVGITTGACSKEKLEQIPHTHLFPNVSPVLSLLN